MSNTRTAMCGCETQDHATTYNEVEEAANREPETKHGEVGAREEGQAAAEAAVATIYRRRHVGVVGVATTDGAAAAAATRSAAMKW